jgi:FAD synthase
MIDISGTVVMGKKIATGRGMPTANILSDLRMGIYTGECEYGGCLLFVADPPCTEVHIIGYEGSLYGEDIDIYNIVKVPQIITDLAYEINKEN